MSFHLNISNNAEKRDEGNKYDNTPENFCFKFIEDHFIYHFTKLFHTIVIYTHIYMKYIDKYFV